MIAGRLLLGAATTASSRSRSRSTTIVETLMDIGLGPVTVRAVARDGEGAGTLFRHVLGLKIVWGALGLAAARRSWRRCCAAIRRSIRACYLMGVSSAIRSYLLTARGLLQGLDRFDLEARDRSSPIACCCCALGDARADRRIRAARPGDRVRRSRVC